jgi:hypothetical protein
MPREVSRVPFDKDSLGSGQLGTAGLEVQHRGDEPSAAPLEIPPRPSGERLFDRDRPDERHVQLSGHRKLVVQDGHVPDQLVENSRSPATVGDVQPALVLAVTPEAKADDTRFVYTFGVDAHSAVAESTTRATQGNRPAPHPCETLVERRHAASETLSVLVHHTARPRGPLIALHMTTVAH